MGHEYVTDQELLAVAEADLAQCRHALNAVWAAWTEGADFRYAQKAVKEALGRAEHLKTAKSCPTNPND